MPDRPSSLVAAVEDRVVAGETARRLGHGAPLLAVPNDGARGPLTQLAGRAFPPALVERRVRFLRAVGWLEGDVGECRPGVSPALPAIASLEDRIAVVAVAAEVVADDEPTAALAAALGRPVRGMPPPAVDEGAWDELFDALADVAAPGWRGRRPAAGAPWSALEARTCEADALFGRRRSASAWPLLRGAARQAGESKRRWFG